MGQRAVFLLSAMALLLAGTASFAAKNKIKPAPAVTTLPAEAVMENASRIHPPSADYRFAEGVVYHYKAEWRLLTAGVASLRVDRDASGRQRVSATADSTGFVARLFHVHDYFDSAFDSHTFCSQQISKRTEEGSHLRDVQIAFDYDKHKSILNEVNRKSGEKKHAENDIPACSTDVLSALFYTSSLPLQSGMIYSFPINDGGKTVDLQARVEGRERIKTEAGTFNTVRVHTVPSGTLVKSKAKIWIWYSDDAERIPVQMSGHMGWGTLTLRLESIERPAIAQSAK